MTLRDHQVPAETDDDEGEQADGSQQGQTGAAMREMEDEHHQQGQQPRRPLGQEGQPERGPHAVEPPARAATEARLHITTDRQGFHRGQHEVGVDGIGGQEWHRARDEDQRGQPGTLRHQAATHGEQQAGAQGEGQCDRQAHRPFVVTEGRDTGGDGPVRQRRLGEVQRLVVAAQGDEVAGMQHLQRDIGVAALVGLEQAARALEGQPEQQGEGEDGKQRVAAEQGDRRQGHVLGGSWHRIPIEKGERIAALFTTPKETGSALLRSPGWLVFHCQEGAVLRAAPRSSGRRSGRRPRGPRSRCLRRHH